MTDSRDRGAAVAGHQARRAGSELPAARKTRKDMAALGVTPRQLEYWVEMGWVHSTDMPARGHPRTFSDIEKAVLALMVRLTAAGFSARKAAPLARRVAAEAERVNTGGARVALAAGLVLEVHGIRPIQQA